MHDRLVSRRIDALQQCFLVIHSMPLSALIYWFPVFTKTCLHNVDPLKPHFYIVKLGLTGVYIIFLISATRIFI